MGGFRAQQDLNLMGIGYLTHISCGLLFPWIHNCKGTILTFSYSSCPAEAHGDQISLPA
jgi:hypothetical protein